MTKLYIFDTIELNQECYQRDFNIFDKLETLIPLSAIYFLEKSVRLSQKHPTKNSYLGKKKSMFKMFEGRNLKQKHRSATKEIYVFMMILQRLHLVQSNIF